MSQKTKASIQLLKSSDLFLCGISCEMIASFGCIENIYIRLYASLLSFACVHSLLKKFAVLKSINYRLIIIHALKGIENKISQADSQEILFSLLTKEIDLTYIKEVALFSIFGSMPASRQMHRNE